MVGTLVASILILGPNFAAAPSVTPIEVADNPSCLDLNVTWNELKVDPPVDGIYQDNIDANPGPLEVDVDFNPDVESQTVDWTSTSIPVEGVDAVIVKGANSANVYNYDPPSEALSDTGLTTPGTAAISHVSFCYDENMVGGTGLQIDKTAMLLAGAQMNAAWLIPVLVAGIGFAIVIARKF